MNHHDEWKKMETFDTLSVWPPTMTEKKSKNGNTTMKQNLAQCTHLEMWRGHTFVYYFPYHCKKAIIFISLSSETRFLSLFSHLEREKMIRNCTLRAESSLDNSYCVPTVKSRPGDTPWLHFQVEKRINIVIVKQLTIDWNHSMKNDQESFVI